MNSLCRRIGGLIEREVDGEVLVLDTRSNLIHKMNRTASVIWRKYQEGASASEIAEVLANDFNVEHDQLEEDVQRTIETFSAWGVR
jgi:hypothetical protein